MLFERWYRFSQSVPVPSWVPSWSVFFALPLAVLAGYGILSRVAPYLLPRRRRESVLLLFRQTRLPVQIMLLALVAGGAVRFFDPGDAVLETLDLAVPLVIVAATAMFLYRLVGTVFVALRSRFDIRGADNLKARQVTTQIVVLERVVGVVIVIIAVAAGLMTIPGVRQWGASLLASAGIIGLLIGFAAQQTIANVLAGIQIAITQPLRIDDAVVIDGEWGWVEEITLTYVVVRVWDKRRLVVPISYLLQKPFQNWTRSTSSIIGTVFLYADYTVDIDELRVEQTRFLAASELWDGEVDVIQMTNTTEYTVELRSLVSAENSPKAWDLRCQLREHLVDVLKTRQPAALPRQRMRLQGTISSRDPIP
jgi:small-conductance mechanosensitive channel